LSLAIGAGRSPGAIVLRRRGPGGSEPRRTRPKHRCCERAQFDARGRKNSSRTMPRTTRGECGREERGAERLRLRFLLSKWAKADSPLVERKSRWDCRQGRIEEGLTSGMFIDFPSTDTSARKMVDTSFVLRGEPSHRVPSDHSRRRMAGRVGVGIWAAAAKPEFRRTNRPTRLPHRSKATALDRGGGKPGSAGFPRGNPVYAAPPMWKIALVAEARRRVIK